MTEKLLQLVDETCVREGLRLKDLAERAETHPTTLYLCSTGASTPRRAARGALARALGVSSERLHMALAATQSAAASHDAVTEAC